MCSPCWAVSNAVYCLALSCFVFEISGEGGYPPPPRPRLGAKLARTPVGARVKIWAFFKNSGLHPSFIFEGNWELGPLGACPLHEMKMMRPLMPGKGGKICPHQSPCLHISRRQLENGREQRCEIFRTCLEQGRRHRGAGGAAAPQPPKAKTELKTFHYFVRKICRFPKIVTNI